MVGWWVVGVTQGQLEFGGWGGVGAGKSGGAQEKTIGESLFSPSRKCCADSLSVCPSLVCIRTHKDDHSKADTQR